MEKSLTQTGGQLFCQRYWKQLLKHIVEGRLDPSWEFTHAFRLEQIDEAYKVSHHATQCQHDRDLPALTSSSSVLCCVSAVCAPA